MGQHALAGRRLSIGQSSFPCQVDSPSCNTFSRSIFCIPSCFGPIHHPSNSFLFISTIASLIACAHTQSSVLYSRRDEVRDEAGEKAGSLLLLLNGDSGGLLCHVVGGHFGSGGGDLGFVEREDVVVVERRGIPAKVIGSSAFTMMWHFIRFSVARSFAFVKPVESVHIICFPNALIHSYTDWESLISYPKNSQGVIIDANNNSGRKICAYYIPTNVEGITTPAAMIIEVANTVAHRHALAQPFLC